MHIKKLREDIIVPTRGSDGAMAYDIYMPDAGTLYANQVTKVDLGFELAIPQGWGAMIFPRSGMGAKFGVELNNTSGLIDQDYRGEWMLFLKLKQLEEMKWKKDDRLVQFVVVPVLQTEIQVVKELPPTTRGRGGFGSTGN